MSQLPGWMPELLGRINIACPQSRLFAITDPDARVQAWREVCKGLWPFIEGLPLNIAGVLGKVPPGSDAAARLLSQLADEERHYQQLYLKQCDLGGITAHELRTTLPSVGAAKLSSAMRRYCQDGSYAEGVYAIVSAELSATAYARCALPWFEEYFASNLSKFDASLVDEGLTWLRLHAQPNLRHAIWMRKMLGGLEESPDKNSSEPVEVVLSAIFEVLQVPPEALERKAESTTDGYSVTQETNIGAL
jgi:pyrroloquinoline quinone (PQQ) biosynthesis protein C